MNNNSDKEESLRFSHRIGKKPIKCNLQVESMDDDLRNGLWNILWGSAVGGIELSHYRMVADEWRFFLTRLWHGFFKWQVDEIPWHSAECSQQQIKEWFFKAQWYEVYDFIEFVAQDSRSIETKSFKVLCNEVLKKECSGYRFVGDRIAPISSKVETGEIEGALDTTEKHGLSGVHQHLATSLELFSDRESPDYRNSIKESISAVESLSMVISGDAKATLGEALKKVRETVGLHPALEKGFSAIYGYTSDEGGIRHAMIEQSNCDFDDAKYMLVSCSAFVNYLIAKAGKAGLIK